MICKFCNMIMRFDSEGEYECDCCGSTYDFHDDCWNEPTQTQEQFESECLAEAECIF